jgi:hypothetical protein
MSARVFHALVGYDKTTGEVRVEYPVPDSQLAYAKATAGVGPDDPDAVLCYELSPSQTGDIAGAIGVGVDGKALNFYLEGSDAPVPSQAA